MPTAARAAHLCGVMLLTMTSGTNANELPPPQIAGPTRDETRGIDAYTIDSAYLGRQCALEVLTPQRLDPRASYRTLYVLPVEGRHGRHGDGLEAIRLADAHNRYGLVCVQMEFDSVPWYGAHATDPSIRHEQYLKDVVVPLVESRYPTTGDPSDRLLIGFSKSGWGAVSLLLRDPAFFGAACAWDAPLMMTEENLRWGSKRHFGTPEAARPHVPVHLVPQRAAALAQGAPRLTILGRDLYGDHARAFHALLDEHRVPHRYDNGLRYQHRWDSGWVPDAIDLFLGRPSGD